MEFKPELVRWIDYYDLIEFPSGRHIPVPIAIKTVGLKEVLKIPVADKKRDQQFYYCEDCDKWGYYPYSFFRCTHHKPITSLETKTKIHLLHAFINAGMHDHLKYIEIDPKLRSISKGRIEIIKDWLVFAYGNMIGVREI